MTDMRQRLASWRTITDRGAPPPELTETTGRVEAHFRQQLARSQRLFLESLMAYEAFASRLLTYVASGNRSPELQQKVTDFAAGMLHAYEITNGRALEQAISNILQNLPREVVQTVYQELPSPQQSVLRRLFGG